LGADFKRISSERTELRGLPSRLMPDGSLLDGAPRNDLGDGMALAVGGSPSVTELLFPGDKPSMVQWRSSAVPWVPEDINETLKSMTPADQRNFGLMPGVSPPFNGSTYYPAKVPDLIGVRDRNYIDHTATHRLRGPEDLMRYAALLTCCDIPLRAVPGC
jgi:hypothetical protein